jgi:outer membrane receptor protein involved in Fe transport
LTRTATPDPTEEIAMNRSDAQPQHAEPFHPSRLRLVSAIWLALGAAPLAFAQQHPLDAAADAAPDASAEAAANAEAQDQDSSGSRTLEAVTVTAQKRAENLQEVPISIQVLGVEKLKELQVADFDDFARYLPSVSIESGGPGFGQVYMRGVASGSNGNHSGPLPSVGQYLDEQPITTIQGALDVHIYDIERVESLAGPQGTLYGASSQAGTIRIITNKPDPSGFSAAYGVEANKVSEGGAGGVGEAYVNLPITDSAAVRLVAWRKRDAGYIDNVPGTRTFPTSEITDDNFDLAKDDYNSVDTSGVRGALQFDLFDGWTVTPTVMAQRTKAGGIFAFDRTKGDLELSHGYPERSDDRWAQAALTVQGKIGNFDITYAFANLNRDVDTETDYSDYAFWYDTLYGYGSYFYDDDGDLVNPSQYIQGRDIYRKRSHELRLSSPADDRLRFTAGLFWQRQTHDIQQRYRVDDLAEIQSVTGWQDTIWLTKQLRTDKDRAVFGEIAYDLTDALTLSAGARFFNVDNSLKGFFGFTSNYSSRTGEAACFDQTDFNGAPCINLDKNVDEDDHVGKVNLTYQLSDTKMVYATWSEGYRAGGINRRGTLPPYLSDFLTNLEAGWKTTWLDNTLAFNGAVFHQTWEDFQFALLGANGLTEIKNANQAEINGLEMDLQWALTYNFTLTGGVAFYDAELTENYCGETDANGVPIIDCDEPQAPEGTQLPITAKVKGNLVGRYNFDWGDYAGYLQGAVVHEGERKSDLRLAEREILGDLPAYTTLDLSLGFAKDDWKVDFYIRNVTDKRGEISRFAQCAEAVCGQQTYVVPIQPRIFGVRFSQEF